MTTAIATARVRRKELPKPANTLDLEYLHAKPIVTRSWTKLQFVLVGCGGTGSWLAPSIARMASEMLRAGKDARVRFVDPDTVEGANVPRQNFCSAEIGCNKAATLALRFGTAWGLDIEAVPAPFDGKEMFWPGSRELQVIVGCVDNAAARRAIAECVVSHNSESARRGEPPYMWWLDCGNGRESGQVLLGSSDGHAYLRHAFEPSTICRALPMPTMQRPELLEALPEEITDTKLSCAEIAVRNAQSLMVNQSVAAVAADYLLRLVMTGGLKRFATYIDLPSGVTKSFYTSPASVARAMGKKEMWFTNKKGESGGETN